VNACTESSNIAILFNTIYTVVYTFTLFIFSMVYGVLIRLRNDLYCVGWGVKLYSLTHVWGLDDSKINEFCTTWRRGLRKIWNLPYRAHCDILSNDIPVFDEICKRSLRFINTCLSHSNDLVRFFCLAWCCVYFRSFVCLVEI